MSLRKPHPRSLRQAQVIAKHYNYLAGDAIALSLDPDIGHATRMDANETVMLALQLEDMRTRVYETQYPELKARLFIPTSNDVNTGANEFSWEETDEVGEAKIIANYGDDLPTADVSGTKQTRPVVPVGVSYLYTLQDIRRAAFAGKPLSARKAQAARRAFERKVDAIAAVGAPDWGIATGFLNATGVAVQALASAGTWATKIAANTPALVLNDLNLLVRAVYVDSKELWRPDTVLLPTLQFMQVSQTRMAADTGETILEAFLRANPFVTRVDSWNKLDGAGVGPSDRAVAFASDPEVVEHIIPQEFEVFAPQPKNLAFQVACHGRTGGVIVTRPLGVKYMDGI